MPCHRSCNLVINDLCFGGTDFDDLKEPIDATRLLDVVSKRERLCLTFSSNFLTAAARELCYGPFVSPRSTGDIGDIPFVSRSVSLFFYDVLQRHDRRRRVFFVLRYFRNGYGSGSVCDSRYRSWKNPRMPIVFDRQTVAVISLYFHMLSSLVSNLHKTLS